jgi:hypothetical protein
MGGEGLEGDAARRHVRRAAAPARGVQLALGEQVVLGLAAEPLGIVAVEEVTQAVAADLPHSASRSVPDHERLGATTTQPAVVATCVPEALTIERARCRRQDTERRILVAVIDDRSERPPRERRRLSLKHHARAIAVAATRVTQRKWPGAESLRASRQPNDSSFELRQVGLKHPEAPSWPWILGIRPELEPAPSMDGCILGSVCIEVTARIV